MALTIYPSEGYDSFISAEDANTFLEANSMYYDTCVGKHPDIAEQEVMLRIATRRILDVIDISLLPTDTTPTCIAESCAFMAIHDCWYQISLDQNSNKGVITKEKVDGLEINYQHKYNATAKLMNPFPSNVVKCLNSYGANITSGKSSLSRATLIKG